MIRALRVIILAIGASTLAACASASGFNDLDREATTADVLPTDLPAYATEALAEESVRFAGQEDGIDYYLARRTEDGGVCVVVYRSADEWVTGCGGGGTVVVNGIGVNVVVAPDDSPELDTGTPVGANIVVR